MKGLSAESFNSTMATKIDVKPILDSLIASHKAVVFSKGGCPYCLGARNKIRKHFGYGISSNDVAFVDIETEGDKTEIESYLRGLTGGPSVPKVFINGTFIGGIDQTTALHKSGELATMFNDKSLKQDLNISNKVDNKKKQIKV